MSMTRQHLAALDGQIDTLATMDVGALWDRILGEFLGEYSRLQRQQLPADELSRGMEAFMEDLSNRDVEDLARQSSSVAYNQGRGAAILGEHASGAVEFVVRSEVLDNNTCEACVQLDGMIVEVGDPAFHEWMPPAKCLGGDRCRGFYIAMAGGN